MSVREPDPLREHVDALQQQVTHLKDAADRARRGKQRADQGAHPAGQGRYRCPSEPAKKAGQAAERGQSQWQSTKADAQAKMRDLHPLGRKRGA